MDDSARLRFLCRRGMKELDVLFERYLQHRFDHAAAAERGQFRRVLECEDPEIWAWVMDQVEPPAEFRDVLERLRHHP